MYKVIMAPTEGSDSEKVAISVAVKLAHRFEADLRLVRVKSEPLVVETIAQMPVLPTEQLLWEERVAHLRKLEALGSECRALGEIRVMTALEDGHVFDAHEVWERVEWADGELPPRLSDAGGAR